MYGGDVVVPLRWFTLTGEAGYFSSADRRADEYVLYVVQVVRQTGEWSFVGSNSRGRRRRRFSRAVSSEFTHRSELALQFLDDLRFSFSACVSERITEDG